MVTAITIIVDAFSVVGLRMNMGSSITILLNLKLPDVIPCRLYHT